MPDIILTHSILLTPLSERGERLREMIQLNCYLCIGNPDKTGQSLTMYLEIVLLSQRNRNPLKSAPLTLFTAALYFNQFLNIPVVLPFATA